ncbi:MAG TPA: peptide deformylase [bacterium]|nr:peptide deformylase [bacterium]
MAIREIRLLGDPVLRERATAIEAIDEEVRQLARDLEDTLAKADGVGLAAPQIGVGRRILLAAPPPANEGDPPPPSRIYVNPEVVESFGPAAAAEEGCLSIPGIYEVVKRPPRVRIKAIDLEGREIDEILEGIPARILQHEIDHLNGVLFIDRIGPMRRALLKNKLRSFLE